MRGPFWDLSTSFMSLHAVPPCVSYFLHYLAEQISQCRHHDCLVKLFSDQLAPRVDNQASSTRKGIGGWFPQVDDTGKIVVKASELFSLGIGHGIFEKGSKPALIISTLEALAVVVALKVYCGEVPGVCRSRVRVAPATTDNRGNGAAVNKLMTTRYAASVVLMELAAYSKKMGLSASVEWSPREANREADALANEELSLFTLDLRIPVSHRQEAHQAAKATGLPTRNQKRQSQSTRSSSCAL